MKFPRLSTQSDRQTRAMSHEQAIEAALINEQLTRQRVEKLERLRDRGLLGRLTWLFRGR